MKYNEMQFLSKMLLAVRLLIAAVEIIYYIIKHYRYYDVGTLKNSLGPWNLMMETHSFSKWRTIAYSKFGNHSDVR